MEMRSSDCVPVKPGWASGRASAGDTLPRGGTPSQVDDVGEHRLADGGIHEAVEPEETVAFVTRAIDLHGGRFCHVPRVDENSPLIAELPRQTRGIRF